MSNTIIIKNGNHIPSSADLAQAELGFDFSEKKMKKWSV